LEAKASFFRAKAPIIWFFRISSKILIISKILENALAKLIINV